MFRAFHRAANLCALLLLTLTAGLPVWGQEEFEPPPDGPVVSDSAREMPFREAIDKLESSEGAYASGLPEQMLSLGLTLQQQGRHAEAAELLKRGVHLARINNGLYSAEQIPLLSAEINSHLALGEYAKADERQQYMYRVQLRSLDNGQVMTAALMQQANWQLYAYNLGIGGPTFLRLMNMWDLYRQAINEILRREDEYSTSLLPPLYGMLKTQYLISSYEGEPSSSGFNSSEQSSGSVEQNRFNRYRADNYKRGRAVIQAIYDIEQARAEDEPSLAAAEIRVMLGDWFLHHQQHDAAGEAYALAFEELAALDDAQVQTERLLGQPVALPDLDGVRPLPDPVPAEQANVLLEFGVSHRGRVQDLERVDENESNEARAYRLMRKLRRTRFRPSLVDGVAVETEKVSRAYYIEDD